MHTWRVPSGNGLEIGRVWVRKLAASVESVIKRSHFEGIAVPNIDSAEARERLRRFLGLPDSEGDDDER